MQRSVRAEFNFVTTSPIVIVDVRVIEVVPPDVFLAVRTGLVLILDHTLKSPSFVEEVASEDVVITLL